jgi:hypothetical protein
MEMESSVIDARILLLEKKKEELQNFLQSAINDALGRRKKELEELGIDLKRPDVAEFIESFRKTEMEALGRKELEAIENEIKELNKSLQH